MKNSGFSAPCQTIIVFCPVPNALAKDIYIYITRITRINDSCGVDMSNIIEVVNGQCSIEDWAFSWGFNDR